MRIRCAAAIATFVALAFPGIPGAGAGANGGCNVVAGGIVILESDATDPDVFLWDSRLRLVDYAAGQWVNTRAVVAHTLLAEPGTEALVVACVPAAAHPKFAAGDADAIGVKIVSGPYRGRYGWVLSSDTRSPHPADNAVVRTRRS